jgi:hypothetical protein
MVYEFALQDDDGIFFRRARYLQGGSSAGARTMIHPAIFTFKDSAHNFNQLKYVCHLTYDETKGQGLKINDLVFAENDISSAASVCSGFLRSCSIYHRYSIKRITIIEPFSFQKWRVASLFDLAGAIDMRAWCTRLPNITVPMRMTWTELNLIDYNYYGIILGMLNNKIDSVPYDLYPWNNEIMDDLRWAVNAKPLLKKKPLAIRNLRFAPADSRFNMLEWGDSDLLDEWPNQYWIWFGRAQDWHENGF